MSAGTPPKTGTTAGLCGVGTPYGTAGLKVRAFGPAHGINVKQHDGCNRRFKFGNPVDVDVDLPADDGVEALEGVYDLNATFCFEVKDNRVRSIDYPSAHRP